MTDAVLEAQAVYHSSVCLENPEIKMEYYPDGTSEKIYVLEGDITVTEEEFFQMLYHRIG